MIRAFIALPLPDAVRRRLETVQFLLPLPRRVVPDSFHVTLAFLGAQPETVLEDLHDDLATIQAPVLHLQLEGFGLYGHPRPRSLHACVAPDPELVQLQRRIARACRFAGIVLEARRFDPHVTLGRFAPGIADTMRLERAVADGAGFRDGPFAVDRFALLRSDLGAEGPRHSVLADYMLDQSRLA